MSETAARPLRSDCSEQISVRSQGSGCPISGNSATLDLVIN